MTKAVGAVASITTRTPAVNFKVIATEVDGDFAGKIEGVGCSMSAMAAETNAKGRLAASTRCGYLQIMLLAISDWRVISEYCASVKLQEISIVKTSVSASSYAPSQPENHSATLSKAFQAKVSSQAILAVTIRPICYIPGRQRETVKGDGPSDIAQRQKI